MNEIYILQQKYFSKYKDLSSFESYGTRDQKIKDTLLLLVHCLIKKNTIMKITQIENKNGIKDTFDKLIGFIIYLNKIYYKTIKNLSKKYNLPECLDLVIFEYI